MALGAFTGIVRIYGFAGVGFVVGVDDDHALCELLNRLIVLGWNDAFLKGLRLALLC